MTTTIACASLGKIAGSPVTPSVAVNLKLKKCAPGGLEYCPAAGLIRTAYPHGQEFQEPPPSPPEEEVPCTQPGSISLRIVTGRDAASMTVPLRKYKSAEPAGAGRDRIWTVIGVAG